ncbi:hypothetical protein NOS3756_05900 [Nostoc sp. NIES-3756]|nr:hypothetical protein NOS3756_05900 [Nostoc sp. NIES-3756]BAY40623.1 hypothetical protein NIES2111_50100 [Nostoc sp. NIES-2111]
MYFQNVETEPIQNSKNQIQLIISRLYLLIDFDELVWMNYLRQICKIYFYKNEYLVSAIDSTFYKYSTS